MLKYKLGEAVWVLKEGKAVEAVVVARQLNECFQTTQQAPVKLKPFRNETRTYQVTIGPDLGAWHSFPEDQMFTSKQELIESL